MTQTLAFTLTLAIEVPVVVGIAAALRWAPGRLGGLALLALAANALTHPTLWLVDPLLARTLATPMRWTVLELAVAAVEASAYATAGRMGWRRGAVLSIVANSASFAAGLVIYAGS